MHPSSQNIWFLLAGTAIGFLSTFIANLIRSKLEMYSKRCEEFCKEVINAADISSEYWLSKMSSENIFEGNDAKAIEKYEQVLLIEAKIEGFQARILQGLSSVRSEMPQDIMKTIDENFEHYLESLTGGKFKARDGNREMLAATVVQFYASEVVSGIRLGVQRNFTLLHMAKKVCKIH